jgi:hypothetical protein
MAALVFPIRDLCEGFRADSGDPRGFGVGKLNDAHLSVGSLKGKYTCPYLPSHDTSA